MLKGELGEHPYFTRSRSKRLVADLPLVPQMAEGNLSSTDLSLVDVVISSVPTLALPTTDDPRLSRDPETFGGHCSFGTKSC